MKSKLKDQMIRLVEADAKEKVATFSIAFARASSEEKETFLAAMEIERWIADTCCESLQMH